MPVLSSKIINVIEVKSSDGLTYFTLDGLKIGGFTDMGIDTDEHPVRQPRTPTVKPGAIAKIMTPKQARLEKDKNDGNLADRIAERRTEEEDETTD